VGWAFGLGYGGDGILSFLFLGCIFRMMMMGRYDLHTAWDGLAFGYDERHGTTLSVDR